MIFDTTPGPAMTLCATFFYFLAVLFSPSQGLLFRYNQNRIEKRRILREDILRQVVKQQPKGTSIATLSKRLVLPEKKIKRTVSLMAKSNLLAFESGSIILTAAGIDKADQLVRAHRLWETYQVRKMGLETDQIHNEADQIEHFLTEELLDEIDIELGFPTKDPHDSPIPSKK